MTIPQAFQIALQHHQAGRLAEAEALYRQILGAQPNHAEAHNNLGVALRDRGRFEEAIAAYRRALELQPDSPETHTNLGNAFSDLGRLDEAIAAHRRAIEIKPDFPNAHNNLGNALRDRGQLSEAISAYRLAIQWNPNYPDAHSNLGNALREQGQFDEAIAACRRALRIKPDFAEAHNNLGNALRDRGQLDDAIAAHRRALELKPGYPDAYNNLGNALRDRGRLDDAIGAYRRALELKPGYPEAQNNLGNALRDCGQLDEAIAAFLQALRWKPDDSGIHGNLIHTLYFVPGENRGRIAEEQRRWNRQFSEPVKQSAVPHSNDRNPDRPLRIGYVSPDFRNHVVGRNLIPLFQAHDRRRFEILCYSGVARPDTLTEEFHRLANRWRSTVGVGDEALAGMIREDGVDILVDLTQHMAGNRLPVFARHAAPVQVSFAGYPESTGLEDIEYRISDRYLEADLEAASVGSVILVGSAGPVGEGNAVAGLFEAGGRSSGGPTRKTEHIFLIDSFWCYDPCGSDAPINPLPALKTGTVTFGCLNSFCKVNEQTLKLWAGVLRNVKASRLVIQSPAGNHRRSTLAAFEREGIESQRVKFVESRPQREYLELYHQMDMVLDTTPYNGHTTNLDALWMGVPVVSLAGKAPVSRAGLSQLTNLGLPELVAHSETEYITIAESLARDLPRLAELRSSLRDRMRNSILMDARRFARQVEQAFREMWRTWRPEQSPTRAAL